MLLAVMMLFMTVFVACKGDDDDDDDDDGKKHRYSSDIFFLHIAYPFVVFLINYIYYIIQKTKLQGFFRKILHPALVQNAHIHN